MIIFLVVFKGLRSGEAGRHALPTGPQAYDGGISKPPPPPPIVKPRSQVLVYFKYTPLIIWDNAELFFFLLFRNMQKKVHDH